MNALIPEIQSFEEAPILEYNSDRILGWHVTGIGKSGILGGGFHQNRETARRIAIAELLERKTFRTISSSSLREDFDLIEFPTTCGFAAGFEDQKTKWRAISEAVERWAWSHWIDKNHYIPEIQGVQKELSPLSSQLLREFEGVRFYRKTIDTSSIPDFFPRLEVGIVICEKNGGIFPGSRAALSVNQLWDHGVLEAWRHCKIFQETSDDKVQTFPYDRILHFGRNKEDAEAQIKKANKLAWPKPELRVLKSYSETHGFYLWRCLMKDFIGWHLGQSDRFVF